ncbi:hypothetical protein [Leucobacter denitrificans]|uniref:Uncharacterized protein n=1 Tax=Leucobacter denitrificans TaxID=683042 RepID=A0A7G9S3F7_9MICO|nr:hypothetical protein [Leucobacter denitrificans]QNN62382.1 hypothetical protein H9L06_08945 [Leucobacter denitrificans]
MPTTSATTSEIIAKFGEIPKLDEASFKEDLETAVSSGLYPMHGIDEDSK